jgi:hypothetical protein
MMRHFSFFHPAEYFGTEMRERSILHCSTSITEHQNVIKIRRTEKEARLGTDQYHPVGTKQLFLIITSRGPRQKASCQR